MRTVKRTPIKKTRKQVSSKKLTEYAKQGRGKNAFVPRKNRKHNLLQERIDQVVAKAMQRESNPQYDVIRHENRRVRLSGAHKVSCVLPNKACTCVWWASASRTVLPAPATIRR